MDYRSQSAYACCGERFSEMKALQTHLDGHFSATMTMRYSCTICGAVIRRKADINDHIFDSHLTLYNFLKLNRVNCAEIQALAPLLASNPEPMDCDYENEPTNIEQFLDDAEPQTEREMVFEQDLEGNVFHQVAPEIQEDDYPLDLETADSEIVQFILSLRRQFDIADAYLNEILQKTANFFKKKIIPSQLPSNLAARFEKLASSDFLQKQHIDNVAPVTIEKTAIVHTVERRFEIQYFPIKEILRRMLQLADVQQLIKADHEKRFQEQAEARRQEEERIAAGEPGQLEYGIVKESEHFEPEEEDKYKLRLFFYADEFTCLNQLGPSVSETSLLAVYMVVDNLPFFYQSSRKAISTVLLIRKIAVAHLGLDSIFERLIQDLQSFRTPINMGLEKPVAGYAAASAGDNLSLNQLQNVSRGFGTAGSCTCRFCMLKNGETSSYFDLDEVQMREDQKDTNGVFAPANHAPLFYGVDPFHDLDEGVINYFMTAVLKGFYYNQRELDELNQAMRNGSFRNGVIYLKQNHDKIKGSGMQISEFFVKFVFFDTQISLDSDFWKSYLSLRKIDIFAKLENPYYHSMFDHYLQLVDSFTKAFLDLDIRMKPKLHNLVHYPLIVKKLCEPYKLAVLRFERKHQPLKKRSRNSYNHKHREKVLANYIFKATLPRDVGPKFDYNFEKEVCDALINSEIEAKFHPFIDFSENVLVLSECTLNGVYFKHGNCYAIKSVQTFRLFACVFLFKQKDKLKIIGQELKVLNYASQTESFHVQRDQLLKVIDVNNLYYHHVLYAYKANVKQKDEDPFEIINNFHYDCLENHHDSIVHF